MFMPLFLTLLAYVDFSLPPALPKEAVREQFAIAKEDFYDRWEIFEEGKTFVPFTAGRTDEDILEEFKKLNDLRYNVWYSNPDSPIKESSLGYEVSLPLLFEDTVRAKNCAAFAYNNITPYYNASAMCLSDRYTIACEGTRPKDTHKFFTLLSSYQVTHLVRLTASQEGESKKCHPYWEGLLSQTENGEWLLNVPLDRDNYYPVHYFIEEEWLDNMGVDPKKLLALVLKVKNSLDAQENGLLTVHCSAGVGRTGTFLAALAIVDAIDNQETFSIEEIVLRLSLQRVHSVARPVAYLTLYRLAEEYQNVQPLPDKD